MTKNVNLWVDAEKTWILDEAWMRRFSEYASLRGLVTTKKSAGV